MKLFWKEVRDDTVPIAVGKTIWDELPDATVDVEKLEHLFESRAKDLISKVVLHSIKYSQLILSISLKKDKNRNLSAIFWLQLISNLPAILFCPAKSYFFFSFKTYDFVADFFVYLSGLTK